MSINDNSNYIYLLNSTYSKEKIKDIFRECLLSFNITDYIFISELIQDCTVSSISNPTIINSICGNYSISFQFDSSNVTIDEHDLKYILASFIVAIENSNVYQELLKSISFSKNKNFSTFSDLIEDIEEAIEIYKRYGTNFCLMKIKQRPLLSKEKYSLTRQSMLNEVKSVIRTTDKIYIGEKNLFVLLKNISIQNATTIAIKLEKFFEIVDIGVAEWKSSYVVTDILSEVDNHIFIKQLKRDNKECELKDTLNKILDKAILFKEDILITRSEYCTNRHNKYIVFKFEWNNDEYSVLKKYKFTSDFPFYYLYNHEDIADDVLQQIK